MIHSFLATFSVRVRDKLSLASSESRGLSSSATRKFYSHHLSEAPNLSILFRKKKVFSGFPGGSVVKNPPANAGDTALILDPGAGASLVAQW